MSLLKFKRGDQFTTTVRIKNADWTAVNITWATVYFIVRSTDNPVSINDSDSTVILQKDITTHTTPASGITSISFTSTDTNIVIGQYFWEIQVKFSNDDLFSASTGTLSVLNDLNKRS